ncbi:hypothetical protein M9458_047258, partial [Cirrhinus mrigala]
ANGSSGAHGTNPAHRHLLSGEQTFHSIRFLQVPPTHRGPIPGRPEQPGAKDESGGAAGSAGAGADRARRRGEPGVSRAGGPHRSRQQRRRQNRSHG